MSISSKDSGSESSFQTNSGFFSDQNSITTGASSASVSSGLTTASQLFPVPFINANGSWDDLNEPDLSWEGPQMVRFMSWLRNPSEPINNRHALRNHIRRKVEGLLQFTWARLRTQTEDSEDLQVALRKRFGDIWNILDRHSRVLEKQEESFNTCFAALEERLQKLEGVTARLEESTMIRRRAV